MQDTALHDVRRASFPIATPVNGKGPSGPSHAADSYVPTFQESDAAERNEPCREAWGKRRWSSDVCGRSGGDSPSAAAPCRGIHRAHCARPIVNMKQKHTRLNLQSTIVGSDDNRDAGGKATARGFEIDNHALFPPDYMIFSSRIINSVCLYMPISSSTFFLPLAVDVRSETLLPCTVLASVDWRRFMSCTSLFSVNLSWLLPRRHPDIRDVLVPPRLESVLSSVVTVWT